MLKSLSNYHCVIIPARSGSGTWAGIRTWSWTVGAWPRPRLQGWPWTGFRSRAWSWPPEWWMWPWSRPWVPPVRLSPVIVGPPPRWSWPGVRSMVSPAPPRVPAWSWPWPWPHCAASTTPVSSIARWSWRQWPISAWWLVTAAASPRSGTPVKTNQFKYTLKYFSKNICWILVTFFCNACYCKQHFHVSLFILLA